MAVSPEAKDLYQEGKRTFANHPGPEGYKAALRFFTRAATQATLQLTSGWGLHTTTVWVPNRINGVHSGTI